MHVKWRMEVLCMSNYIWMTCSDQMTLHGRVVRVKSRLVRVK